MHPRNGGGRALLPVQAGPEDYSGRTPSGEPKGPGKRRSKIEHGESVKRGCQAHFTIRSASPVVN